MRKSSLLVIAFGLFIFGALASPTPEQQAQQQQGPPPPPGGRPSGGILVPPSVTGLPPAPRQGQLQVMLTPVPPWPADGVIPPELADKQFVFYDLRTGEYVVSYPIGLERGEGPVGERVTFRFDLENRVDPIVSVSIRQQENRYLYEYSITNGTAAKYPIRAIRLLTPPGDQTLQVRHPSWNAWDSRTVVPRPQVALSELYQAGQTPPALRQSMTEGLPVSWSTSEKSLMIARGATVSGFQVESEYLPGFTTMFCSGGQVFSPPRNIPSEVWPQLLPLLRFENNLKSVLTIGPRFAPEFPARDIIASEFLYGINRLARNGQLSSNSAFLTEARKLLEIIIQNPDTPLPAFQSKPSTPMEETLAKAIAISLGSR